MIQTAPLPDFGSYVCAMCGITLKRGRPVAEAEAEAASTWGKPASEWTGGHDEICHDCYVSIDPDIHTDEADEARRNI